MVAMFVTCRDNAHIGNRPTGLGRKSTKTAGGDKPNFGVIRPSLFRYRWLRERPRLSSASFSSMFAYQVDLPIPCRPKLIVITRSGIIVITVIVHWMSGKLGQLVVIFSSFFYKHPSF